MSVLSDGMMFGVTGIDRERDGDEANESVLSCFNFDSTCNESGDDEERVSQPPSPSAVRNTARDNDVVVYEGNILDGDRSTSENTCTYVDISEAQSCEEDVEVEIECKYGSRRKYFEGVDYQDTADQYIVNDEEASEGYVMERSVEEGEEDEDESLVEDESEKVVIGAPVANWADEVEAEEERLARQGRTFGISSEQLQRIQEEMLMLAGVVCDFNGRDRFEHDSERRYQGGRKLRNAKERTGRTKGSRGTKGRFGLRGGKRSNIRRASSGDDYADELQTRCHDRTARVNSDAVGAGSTTTIEELGAMIDEIARKEMHCDQKSGNESAEEVKPKKKKKLSKKQKERLRIKKEEEAEKGRKLFVGGIAFDDLYSPELLLSLSSFIASSSPSSTSSPSNGEEKGDDDGQDELEAILNDDVTLVLADEVATILKDIRIKCLQALFEEFGPVDKIKPHWAQRYCHVVYETEEAARLAFEVLSCGEARRKREEEMKRQLDELSLPATAAPLHNFYVRWPRGADDKKRDSKVRRSDCKLAEQELPTLE
jgi:hypothetical protein